MYSPFLPWTTSCSRGPLDWVWDEELDLNDICIEAPIPGTKAFDTMTSDPKSTWSGLFHFFFHNQADLPELLTHGKEREYITHFYQRLVRTSPSFTFPLRWNRCYKWWSDTDEIGSDSVMTHLSWLLPISRFVCIFFSLEFCHKLTYGSILLKTLVAFQAREGWDVDLMFIEPSYPISKNSGTTWLPTGKSQFQS